MHASIQPLFNEYNDSSLGQGAAGNTKQISLLIPVLKDFMAHLGKGETQAEYEMGNKTAMDEAWIKSKSTKKWQ